MINCVLNEKATLALLKVRLIKMSGYFPGPKSLGERVKVELDLSNYATKTELRNATDVDTSFFAKITDLANLKSNVNKSHIDKLKMYQLISEI